jgi:hypothetical protein
MLSSGINIDYTLSNYNIYNIKTYQDEHSKTHFRQWLSSSNGSVF